jgi:hypothetical protein
VKRLAITFIVLVASFGVGRSAKADSVTFTFTGANSAGYIDARGTLTGYMTWLSDPAVLNLFEVDSGTITVTSNIAPTPWPSSDTGDNKIPEFNGNSDTSLSRGGFILSNSAGGVTLETYGGEFGVCFEMPGNPADGGSFIFAIDAFGVNGTTGNAGVVGTDDGTVGYLYGLPGTLTVYGQLGDYDLTPEPSSWLLLGSGAILLGFLIYRRPGSGSVAHL